MTERVSIDSLLFNALSQKAQEMTLSLGFDVNISQVIAHLLKKSTEVVPVQELTNDHRVRLDGEVANLMHSGRKIDAIKLVRYATNLGLKEAKEYAERFPYTDRLPVRFP